ncbi:MAG: ribose-5-phosphate isomerase RpiA [Thermomicrobiales bacterium]|nr:ribose-5-phosphate isomerase RpiA [Thermomicrobiales bacterium]
MALGTNELLASIGAYAANMVEDGMIVGLGTGSTAAAMVDALGVRARDGLRVTGVATSTYTQQQAESYGIPVVDLADIDRLDMCIDGADEIDPELNLVKGRGGALLFEKLVALRANHYVIIAASDKLVNHLGVRMPLPVEIIPIGWTHTTEAIRELGLEPVLRMDGDKPYVTDGQHCIVDCTWPSEPLDPIQLARDLKAITGVVEHGLFIHMTDVAVTIDPDGVISEHHR